MMQNAYFLAKIDADTAENERNFAKILTKNGLRARAHRAGAAPIRPPAADASKSST